MKRSQPLHKTPRPLRFPRQKAGEFFFPALTSGSPKAATAPQFQTLEKLFGTHTPALSAEQNPQQPLPLKPLLFRWAHSEELLPLKAAFLKSCAPSSAITTLNPHLRNSDFGLPLQSIHL